MALTVTDGTDRLRREIGLADAKLDTYFFEEFDSCCFALLV